VQAITFCHEAKNMPQACKELCESAMHHRIGTKELETPPAIAEIRPEDLASSDVCHRIKKFLPKGGKQPESLGPLKTLIDERKAAEYVKLLEETKKKEEALEETKKKEEADEEMDTPLSALGGATGGAAPCVAGAATGVAVSRPSAKQAVCYMGPKKQK